MRTHLIPLLIVLLSLSCARAQNNSSPASSELAPGSSQVINPEDLLPLLQSTFGQKPLVLNVGPSILYMQAHIPGSEYIGTTDGKMSLERLRTRVKSLPHDQSIVLYCGCCPWSRCPNIRPAYNALHAMGFTNVKVLYIADNFGTDWVDKGYPTIKGQ